MSDFLILTFDSFVCIKVLKNTLNDQTIKSVKMHDFIDEIDINWTNCH